MAKSLQTVNRARRLRREMSKPEATLWQRLRGDPQGVRFRRQHPAGPFVLDFYCAKARLAIEVDGIVHDMGDQPEFDEKRSAWLNGEGIEMLRIAASEVLRDPDGVADAIVRYVLDKRE
ncbi:endonuclease domain-containing protein [Novosphingobium sp. JCM 18896]|uniref:endonuclease domain-containing protein n=1 Tax=Novosphingobium sp. JCM 18896 TaxID=2989731 RepID=UPI00222282A2|nr:endonuclease domain-containing protein [Novosphingobium sp. JCM 18896]MCW1431433.1 endonuclease domain-containing protein [Novosphingobium sp. JCM 18896]